MTSLSAFLRDRRGDFAIEMIMLFPVIFILLLVMYYTASYTASYLSAVTAAARVGTAAIGSQGAEDLQVRLSQTTFVGFGRCDPEITITPPDTGPGPYTRDLGSIESHLVTVTATCTAETYFSLGVFSPLGISYTTQVPYNPLLACELGRSSSSC